MMFVSINLLLSLSGKNCFKKIVNGWNNYGLWLFQKAVFIILRVSRIVKLDAVSHLK